MNIKCIKEKLYSFVTSSIFPFVFYFTALLFYHKFITLGQADDAWFRNILADNFTFGAWSDFLVSRFHNWSSRLIIEGLLILLVHTPLLWKILNTIVMLWITIALSIFFNPHKKASVNWFIVLAMLSFPVEVFLSAGWMATTLNYTWVLAAGLFALLPIHFAIRQKKTPRLVLVFSIPLLLFSTNQEQMCAIMFAVLIIFTVYLSIRDKKIPVFLLIETVICIVSLIFILLCPGNEARTAAETETWFPVFAEFSLFKKAELGYSFAMFGFAMNKNLIYTLFCATLCAAVFLKHRTPLLRAVSTLPFIFSLTMGIFPNIFDNIMPHINGIRHSLGKTGTGFILTSPTSWIPLLFVTAIGICILISLWAVFEKKNETLLSYFIILLGLATAAIMGFSPTIWASGTRPFTYMYIAFIAVGTMLALRITESPERHKIGAPLYIYTPFHIMLSIENYYNVLM